MRDNRKRADKVKTPVASGLARLREGLLVFRE